MTAWNGVLGSRTGHTVALCGTVEVAEGGVVHGLDVAAGGIGAKAELVDQLLLERLQLVGRLQLTTRGKRSDQRQRHAHPTSRFSKEVCDPRPSLVNRSEESTFAREGV